MKLTQSQWAALWITEGGNPRKADLASSVVMAESGGDSAIYNGTCCYGGYQINVAVGNTSKKCATDPVCATKWSIKESRDGKDWSAWETYTNGAYQQYLGKSQFASVSDNGNAKMVSLGGDTLKAIQDSAKKLIDPIGSLLGGTTVPGVDVGSIASDVLGKVFNIVGLGDIAKVVEGAGELFLTREGWARIAKLIGGAVFFLWGLRIVIRESTGSDPVKTVAKTAETAAAVATVKV